MKGIVSEYRAYARIVWILIFGVNINEKKYLLDGKNSFYNFFELSNKPEL